MSCRPQVSAVIVEQHTTLARDELRSGGEINAALLANRVLRAVALADVARVVEQRINGLIPFEVYDTEGLSAFDFVNPAFARGKNMIVDRAGRIERAFR